MNEPWRIRLFGGLRARRGDQIVTRFYTYKYGALLAYLAFYRDRAHSREMLVEMFWPTAEAKQAREAASDTDTKRQLPFGLLHSQQLGLATSSSVACHPRRHAPAEKPCKQLPLVC